MKDSSSFTWIVAAVLVGILSAHTARGQNGLQPETDLHARAELVTDVQAIRPNRPFHAGLYVVIDRDWHINWKNPGDAGLAPSLSWKLPPGFTAGEIEWPCPELIREPSLASYGYRNEILLPVEITPPANLTPGDTVLLILEADWLECSGVCIPGRASLKLALPATSEIPPADPRWAQLARIIEDRRPVPAHLAGADVSAEATDREITLHLEWKGLVAPDSVQFFAARSGLIDYAAPQLWSVEGDLLTVRLARSRNSEGDPKSIGGVLYVRPGWGGPDGAQAITLEAALPTFGIADWPQAVLTLILLSSVAAGGWMIRRKRDRSQAHERSRT